MSKVLQIIKREYITRVRKRSFIIMTILGPLIFAAFMIAPYKIATLEDSDMKTIAVVELDSLGQATSAEEQIFRDNLAPKENLKFSYLTNVDSSEVSKILEHGEYYGILVLNQSILKATDSQVEFHSEKQPSVGIEGHIEWTIEDFLYGQNLLRANLSPEEIAALKSDVDMVTQKYADGEVTAQKLVDQKRGIGYAAGFLIYFFIFFFGAQVMRGVIEEKTSRIVEVIITSVRPFQLMTGKIGGIALVALTQFVVWILLTITIYQYGLSVIIGDDFQQIAQQEMVAGSPMNGADASGFDAAVFMGITVKEIVSFLLIFLFYFLGGYLLYGAMFAAIGAAVDSETDTQQFMLPVTIPLILSIIVMINAITNPEGQLVYWFSIIPLTSPVVMMARLPFHPPVEHLITSMVLLILTFILFVWLAGKIYRTGILMYGKKASWKEMIKWVRYKD